MASILLKYLCTYGESILEGSGVYRCICCLFFSPFLFLNFSLCLFFSLSVSLSLGFLSFPRVRPSSRICQNCCQIARLLLTCCWTAARLLPCWCYIARCCTATEWLPNWCEIVTLLLFGNFDCCYIDARLRINSGLNYYY